MSRVVINVSCSEDLYPRKPPSFCPHRRKNTFFRELLSFKASFCILSQQVLTKFCAWKQSPNFLLQNPSFDFFISYLVPEIFLLLGSSTRCPDFQITTFIFGILQEYRKPVFQIMKKYRNVVDVIIEKYRKLPKNTAKKTPRNTAIFNIQKYRYFLNL